MCQMIWNPPSPHPTFSSSLVPLLSPAFNSNTWLLPLQLACWIFHYELILVRFHCQARFGEKGETTLRASQSQKSAILIRGAQLLVQEHKHNLCPWWGRNSKLSDVLHNCYGHRNGKSFSGKKVYLVMQLSIIISLMRKLWSDGAFCSLLSLHSWNKFWIEALRPVSGNC